LSFEKLELSSLGIKLEKFKLKLGIRADNKLKRYWEELQKWTSYYLREPQKRTSYILIKNTLFLRQLEHRRNQFQATEMLNRYRQTLRFKQEKEYRRFLTADNRSRIIAAYHFGDFVYGLNHLMCFENSERNRLVYSQQANSPVYFDNMARAFGERAIGRESLLTEACSSPASLSRQLRNGRCSLVMFCDLPQGYGEAVSVRLLNRQAWFPRGPATLAIVNKSPILPVINYQENGQNQIVIANLIEPCLKLDEDRNAAAARITQQLVSILEEYLLRFPYQWRYLQALPDYFVSKP
jgi:lauroyl/myristoyl acyltransferase